MPIKKPGRRRKPAATRRAHAAKHKSNPRLPTWKKAVYGAVVTLVFFGLLEGALYFAGIRPQFLTTDPYVGFTARIPLFVPKKMPNAPTVMVTAKNKTPWFNEQQFKKEKDPESFRIFCLGGSTTYGRPYGDSTSFCGWLREFLNAADTTHATELINAGGISYASYRVALVLEEVIEYDPDLVIVYTGHNEFLEDRTYDSVRNTPAILLRVGAVLSHSRAYSVFRGWVHHRRAGADTPSSANDLLPAEVATRLDKGVGPDAFYRDDDLQKRILEHFEFNLSRIVDIARGAGIDIILVTPASNLRNCTPFKSEVRADLAADDQARLHQLLESARSLFAESKFSQALEATDAALGIDARCADGHFLRGRCLEQLERYAEAKVAYIRARDEDVCPLRAITAMRKIVLEIADRKQVPVVDFETLADDASANQIPGDSIFLDHVHPTIEGHRLLSLAIMELMIDRQLFEASPQWGGSTIQQVTSAVKRRVDQEANGIALRNLAKVFAWAGKRDEANRMALRAADLISSDANTLYLAGNALIDQGDFAGAIAKLQQAIALNPGHAQSFCSLGVAYQHQSQPHAAETQYKKALEIDADNASAHNNLGALYVGRGQLQQAAMHLGRAVSINPRNAKAHHNLGALYAKQGKLSQALESLVTAVGIDPNSAEAHQDLGNIYQAQGKIDRAVFHYRRALQLEPKLLKTANTIAWLLSTSPNANVRDGQEAVRWALHCAEATGYRQPGVFNTLAAAYAEIGDFVQAAKWQAKALELAPEPLQPTCRQRLKLYQSGQPYRVPSSSVNMPDKSKSRIDVGRQQMSYV